MILLLEPSRLTYPIIKLDPAKQISGIAARKEIWVVLKLKCDLRIGISGPIKTSPARIFTDARKTGKPSESLDFN
jgi:hypothetical protein